MREYVALLVKEIFILMACVAAGLIALILVYFIPRHYMHDNVYESAIVLHNKGLGAHVWENIEETMLDIFTDGLLLNVSYTETEDGRTDILLNTNVEVDGRNPMDSFYEMLVMANDNYIIEHYGRYWHGYQIILRPLLCLFTYSDILQINMILQLALVFVLIGILIKSENWILIVPFFGMYIFLSPVSLFSSLQYSPCFYVMMFALIVIFGLGKNMHDTSRNILFLVAGIATAYFDLLTYPLITLAVPLIACLSYDSRWLSVTKKKVWGGGTLYTISWGIGYVGMWSSKWIIASVLTEENIIYDALEEILYRSGHLSKRYSYIDTLRLNLGVCNTKVLLIVLIGIAIYIISLRVKNHIGVEKKIFLHMTAILFVSFYPFIWYYFTKNHSTSHSYFTWRELGISVFGLLTIGVMRVKDFYAGIER